MAVTLYKSTDGSAPVLSGDAGALITVLDAILVNGYGAKAAAGWTKAFSGTNAASYRQGSGSNQYYLDIDDNAPGAGGGKEARIRGYESMSALATGTAPFPTVAQQTNGLFVRKSTTADSTARPWICLADARTLYFFALTGDTAGIYLPWTFGEYYSFKASDPGRTYIQGRTTENSASLSTTVDGFDAMESAFTATAGLYIARDAQGSVGSIATGRVGDIGLTAGATHQALNGLVAFTNLPDNKVYLNALRFTTTVPSNAIRGRMRGFWHFCHPISSVSDGDTLTGSGELSGKTFLVVKQLPNGGVGILETSNTWDSN